VLSILLLKIKNKRSIKLLGWEFLELYLFLEEFVAPIFAAMEIHEETIIKERDFYCIF
jgi:hypothetical protein